MLQVLVFVVKGPAALVCKAAESVQVALSTVWQGAKPLGQLARSASGLVRTTSLAATTSGASVADVGQQASTHSFCVSSLCCFTSPVYLLCMVPLVSVFECVSCVHLCSVYLLCLLPCGFLCIWVPPVCILICSSPLSFSSVYLLCGSLLYVWSH